MQREPVLTAPLKVHIPTAWRRSRLKKNVAQRYPEPEKTVRLWKDAAREFMPYHVPYAACAVALRSVRYGVVNEEAPSGEADGCT